MLACQFNAPTKALNAAPQHTSENCPLSTIYAVSAHPPNRHCKPVIDWHDTEACWPDERKTHHDLYSGKDYEGWWSSMTPFVKSTGQRSGPADRVAGQHPPEGQKYIVNARRKTVGVPQPILAAPHRLRASAADEFHMQTLILSQTMRPHKSVDTCSHANWSDSPTLVNP